MAQELSSQGEGISVGIDLAGTDAAQAELAAELALPIEQLNLSVRTYNALKR